ncbi:hypothetical protein [Kordiimonas marina]|uniref:hypothetical protein n=1 Tax=Kordiimonas marina TaxID=2872312 RepID=UPI001FF2117C|nr:hypothetical protein [Kordiimonas marina]MCJ9428833.1 hypothetical protein [Kordiimonas marina]
MEKISAFFGHPVLQRLVRFLQIGLMVALVVYLFDRLSDIGWHEVLANLPTTPVFYIVLILNFLLLPASELLIYRPLWPTPTPPAGMTLAALMRKQAFNDAVIGYGGEAFFFLWGRRHLGLTAGKVFSLIKDNNIISAATSSSAALLIVLLFAAIGQLKMITGGAPEALPYIAGALGIGILVVPLLMLFGRHIIKIPRKQAWRVAGLHFGRIILFESLLITQWSVVLPDVPVSTWVGFIAAKMVLTRIPLMPNKELMLLGLAVTISKHVQAGEAALAGLFLAGTAISQILNVSVFLGTSLPGVTGPKTALPDDEPA